MVLVGAHQPYRKPDAYGMMAVSVPLPGQLAVVVVGTGSRVVAVERDVASVEEMERGLSGPAQQAKTPSADIDLTFVVVVPGAFQFDAVERVAPPSKVLTLKGTFCEQCGVYVHRDSGFVDADPS